ncbi:hypothetical protein ILYODFUR_033448 [Ilyodon furcidens]|uniref:Uncharacterized protein n=1 Tax=Ilyodon furcidens TaxID=33524 RepID=A0ABV0T2R4_9TELE
MFRTLSVPMAFEERRFCVMNHLFVFFYHHLVLNNQIFIPNVPILQRVQFQGSGGGGTGPQHHRSFTVLISEHMVSAAVMARQNFFFSLQCLPKNQLPCTMCVKGCYGDLTPHHCGLEIRDKYGSSLV